MNISSLIRKPVATTLWWLALRWRPAAYVAPVSPLPQVDSDDLRARGLPARVGDMACRFDALERQFGRIARYRDDFVERPGIDQHHIAIRLNRDIDAGA